MNMVSSSQIRAARAMLSLEPKELAERAGILEADVIDVESGRSASKASTLQAIRRVLEAAGVEFIPNAGEGAGVRLKDSSRPLEIVPGNLVKYRDGVPTPGVRNVGAVGEVLQRAASLTGEVVVRWPSGEEAEATVSKLQVVALSQAGDAVPTNS